MCINTFIENLKLIKKLERYIEGDLKKDSATGLARDLLKAFPDFNYKGLAYRSILGTWEHGLENLSWSEYKEDSWSAFNTMWGLRKDEMRTYSACVQGFHVASFIEALSEVERVLSKGCLGFARGESEILAVSFNEDSLEEVVSELAYISDI